MIHLRQRIVPRSRTHTGALWEAATEFDGNVYSAASRHGAPQALARVLVAAGVPDQPVEVPLRGLRVRRWQDHSHRRAEGLYQVQLAPCDGRPDLHRSCGYRPYLRTSA